MNREEIEEQIEIVEDNISCAEADQDEESVDNWQCQLHDLQMELKALNKKN